MWEAIGGLAKAQEVNKEVAKYVDVMIGNEEDFTACLGFEIEGNDENLKTLNLDGYKKMINEVLLHTLTSRLLLQHFVRLRQLQLMTGQQSAGLMEKSTRLLSMMDLRSWIELVAEIHSLQVLYMVL